MYWQLLLGIVQKDHTKDRDIQIDAEACNNRYEIVDVSSQNLSMGIQPKKNKSKWLWKFRKDTKRNTLNLKKIDMIEIRKEVLKFHER